MLRKPQLLILLLLLSGAAYAETEAVPTTPPPIGATDKEIESSHPGKIEVQYAPDYRYPYRERRKKWGFQAEVSYENYLPGNFVSGDDSRAYSDLFGSKTIPMISGSLGVKYNLSIGALTADLFAGQGQVNRKVTDTSGTEDRSLSVTREGIAFGYVMDALWREPAIAPYIKGMLYQAQYNDTGGSVDDSGSSGMSYGYTVGLLIQINKWDPSGAAKVANRDYGLNNTYLDIYASEYFPPSSSDDADLGTGNPEGSSLDLGIGLRIEF